LEKRRGRDGGGVKGAHALIDVEQRLLAYLILLANSNKLPGPETDGGIKANGVALAKTLSSGSRRKGKAQKRSTTEKIINRP